MYTLKIRNPEGGWYPVSSFSDNGAAIKEDVDKINQLLENLLEALNEPGVSTDEKVEIIQEYLTEYLENKTIKEVEG